MGRKCCIINCKRRAERDNVKFFRFPLINKRYKKFKKISEQRQRAWLKAINRKDFREESYKNISVCSLHFISGRSAKLGDILNPDWVPSLNLGYSQRGVNNPVAATERYNRMKNKELKKISMQTVNVEIEHPEIKAQTIFLDIHDFNKTSDAICQTGDYYYEEYLNDNLCRKNEKLRDEIEELKEEVKSLRKMTNKICSFDELKNNDKKVKYFTGFPDFTTLKTIFKLVKNYIPLLSSGKITKSDIYVMTLVKIKLDLPLTFLAYQYGISLKSLSKLFHKTTAVLYKNLDFVFLPDYETALKNMPSIFKQLYSEKIPIIIDCLEIFTDRLDARATMCSYYKHHTLKYLLAISPCGNIIFVSKGFGGRCSDKFVMENCGIMSFLKEGDVVLCDNRFLIEETLKKKVRLIMPSFKNSQTKLEPLAVESNSYIGNVRIHVERIIGALRQKFLTMPNRQPISIISEKYEKNLYYDYIVKIICNIINLNPSIVQ